MKSLILIFTIFISAPALAFDHSHRDLTTLLGKIVTYTGSGESQVDYKKLKKEPILLNKYIKEMGLVSQKQFDAFTEAQQQAFLINAYNVFTLKIVNDNYPVKSIKKIGGVFGNTWKIKFIRLLGKELSLDAIEHEMLRKNYTEPRVHFAVNCASVGCPRLRNEAYLAEKLDSQLEEQANVFLQDTTRNKIDTTKKTLQISKIFDWFEEDFLKGPTKSIQGFIAPYITDDTVVQTALKNGEYKIDHLSYNWDLNEKK